MNLPNLPTDNLYKFAAIFGVFLILGSFYAYYWINNKLTKETSEGIQMIDATLVEYDFLSIKLNSLKENMKIFEKNKNEKLFIEIENQTDEILNEIKKYGISRTNTDKKIRNIDIDYSNYKTIKYATYCLSIFGLFMSFWGFSIWKKIQDKELNHQLKKKGAFNKKDEIVFLILFLFFLLIFAKFYLNFSFLNFL